MPNPLLLVLGLQTPTGLHAVHTDGDTLSDLGPVLVVPGRKGWSRVEPVVTAVGGETTHGFAAVQAGRFLGSGSPGADAGCQATTDARLTFVSEALVSVTWEGNGYCGGAHGWAAITHDNRPLAAFRYTPVAPSPVAPSPVAPSPGASSPESAPADPDILTRRWLGKDAPEKLSAAARASLQGRPPEEVDCFKDAIGPPGWALQHREGAWTVACFIPYGYEACRGAEWPFDPGLPAPARLRTPAPSSPPSPTPSPPPSPIPPPPGALDWVVAPGGDWRVEVRAAEVVLVRAGVERGRLPIAGGRIVQTDWAVGEANVGRWREEAPAAAVVPDLGDSRLKFSIALGDGSLLGWEAGTRGLRFRDDAVEVGPLSVALARDFALFDGGVAYGDTPASALLVWKTGTEPPVAFPPGEEAEDVEEPPVVRVLAVDDRGENRGIDVAVWPPGPGAGESGEGGSGEGGPGEGGPLSEPVLRRLPLTEGVVDGAALAGAGVPRRGGLPKPKTTARSLDGRVVATCTAEALELTVDGKLVARTWLSLGDGAEGPEAPPPVTGDLLTGMTGACRIVAVER